MFRSVADRIAHVSTVLARIFVLTGKKRELCIQGESRLRTRLPCAVSALSRDECTLRTYPTTSHNRSLFLFLYFNVFQSLSLALAATLLPFLDSFIVISLGRRVKINLWTRWWACVRKKVARGMRQ